MCDSDSNSVSLDESFSVKEHVYCTVYCIANDSHRKDVEIVNRYDETVASDAPEMDSETGREAGSSPEPTLYTLDDLVDPFGDISHQLYREQAGAESALQSCRVCLEDKTIAPRPSCSRARVR
ncbi:probable E3 ubiquitin-protein ligase RNF217 [Lates japonicus]|uniref:Probable E3 ubiquitin-protein ligase RNF217 n=1 Tax=Lates japonicus TaxID=270547 RepID=A0AAD3NJF1_LATJO|nr:probable E3 ubiquitin-protein ligase RNF217 [Lates japonicus]